MATSANTQVGFYTKNDVYSYKLARTFEGRDIYTNNFGWDNGDDVRGFGGKHDGERRIMGDQPVVFTDKERFNIEIQLLPLQ